MDLHTIKQANDILSQKFHEVCSESNVNSIQAAILYNAMSHTERIARWYMITD